MDEIRQLRAAVWMVGNMDTQEDKASWWHQFGALWERVANLHGLQAQLDADAMWNLHTLNTDSDVKSQDSIIGDQP